MHYAKDNASKLGTFFKVTESNIRTSCFNQCKTSQNKTSQKRPTGASSHSGYRHLSFYLLTYIQLQCKHDVAETANMVCSPPCE